MKCPHCGSGRKQPVYETRRSESCVYRRRTCMGCGRSYVTCESTNIGLRMPAHLCSGSDITARRRAKGAVHE